MQFFEFLLLLGSTVYLIVNRTINKKLKKPYLLGALLLFIVFHLLLEGYRWQMIPGYIIWLIALITAFRQSEKKPHIIIRGLKVAGLVIILALAILLPSVLPVFELPEPSGAYTVATKNILLELDREEEITTDKTDQRRIMLKVWYPSSSNDGEADPYIDKAGRNGFAQKYGLPPFTMDYLDKIETHVYRDLPVAEKVFPVLIFSHGYNSKANGYYALLSEVVSRGYVVFAINHTYESTGTTFPDGDMAYFDYNYANQIESGTWEVVAPAVETFKNGLPFAQRHPVVKKALMNYFVKDMVQRWATDISDVVGALDAWNRVGFFKGKLDLDNIGVFGHSRGGGAAGHSLLIDSNIKAGVNLDGVQWGPIVDTVFQQPFLFVSADWPAEHEDLNSHAYVNKSTSYFYEAMIHGTGHSNFMDIPYMVPLQSLSQAGNIDPDLGIEISTDLVVSFFDKHLKAKPIDMNTFNTKYDMLDFVIFKGGTVR